MRLAEAELAPGERAELAAQCARYFSESLPLHVADEDETLAPRLRGNHDATDAALDAMTEQHVQHRPLLAEVVALLRALALAPQAPELRDRLAPAAAALRAELAAHLELEERSVLPVVEAWPAATQLDALHELRERRRSVHRT